MEDSKTQPVLPKLPVIPSTIHCLGGNMYDGNHHDDDQCRYHSKLVTGKIPNTLRTTTREHDEHSIASCDDVITRCCSNHEAFAMEKVKFPGLK